jgi:hypothetical protein
MWPFWPKRRARPLRQGDVRRQCVTIKPRPERRIDRLERKNAEQELRAGDRPVQAAPQLGRAFVMTQWLFPFVVLVGQDWNGWGVQVG